MVDPRDPTRTDTSDMLAIHQVFRDAIADAPQLIGAVGDGDVARAAVVGSYYTNVLRLLEVHHEGEDELVTPLLVARCDGPDAVVAQRVADQHHEALAPMARADGAVAAFAARPGPTEQAEAIAALDQLGGVLIGHLDDEETEILPLAAAHLSPEEWGALPALGMQRFAGDNLWFMVGLIREAMTPEQRDHMLVHMPPPVADAWRSTGEEQFRRSAAELRRR
jgi:hypothetical protein